MDMLLALFGTLSESGRLALIGSSLIGIALLLRKVLVRTQIPLAPAPKIELPAK
jgi:hypothetical protein